MSAANLYTEEHLVQKTTADYLQQHLGWESPYAMRERLGADGTLGRTSEREVVLARYLRAQLEKLNPGLPDAAYDQAVSQLAEVSAAQSLLAANREKYALIRDGVLVTFVDARGRTQRRLLRVLDFEVPENNHFLCVRELWVRGSLYRRRADVVGFVNGLPLLFMELKNVSRNIRAAYEGNFKDYLDAVPQLFHHNAFVVLANGVDAKIGTVGSGFRHFHEWKRLEEGEPGAVDMETLLAGVCSKGNLLDLLENFTLFDESGGHVAKIMARNHQFLGVNRALAAVRERQARGGKLGVFWHTQGSGKSYSMLFFTRKVHRKLGGNFTFLILTDREELDGQIYKTFAACGALGASLDCRAADGRHLASLLQQHKPYVFSLIQKFNQEMPEGGAYTLRDDVIVISDEAHRTQYGQLALNMRAALPNASYIGFTGTPLFTDDEITRRVFGEYVSTYDFQRAVEDGATVPLYYDARGDKLGVAVNDLNERIAAELEKLEIDDIDVAQRLERALARDYHVITAEKRLQQVAHDFVQHYSTAWESGKAMLVCIDKITCVRVFNMVQAAWQERIAALEKALPHAADEQQAQAQRRQIEWMRETQMAVVVSEEQGELEKFRQWGLDIAPHRRLMKQGLALPPAMRSRAEYQHLQRLPLEDAFKAAEHPFRVAIVCAMWLTGFDVPSLGTLYLDKPLKAHTLMQAIARANRVREGKTNGLIVDYCGILKNLRKALATFAGVGDMGRDDGGEKPEPPVRPQEELLQELLEAIALVREFLSQREASLDEVLTLEGFARNAAIARAKEAANENDATRKRFELLCRAVLARFKACVNIEGVRECQDDCRAINIIYQSLQGDREQADISAIIRRLHEVVDAAVAPQAPGVREERAPYNISGIDFERLRREFARSARKRSTVQDVKAAIEQRLQLMLAQNPTRADFQKRYEEIVEEYNREKDRVTIEKTFEELMRLHVALNGEEQRAASEGMDEESLAIFDLLKKTNLDAAAIKRIKGVAAELLAYLKAGKLRVAQWRAKQATRDAVQITIHDYLYSDVTGLPPSLYSEEDVAEKTHAVFLHMYQTYPAGSVPRYREMSLRS